MKTKLLLSGVALTLGANLVLGVNAEDAKKPAKVVQPKVETSERVTTGEKIAWLGVLGEPVSPVLCEHLGIKKGYALIVIGPKSPAAQAELKKHDVLTKIDSAEIGSQLELRKELRKLKPGSEVTLSFIRKGKKMSKQTILSERPKLSQRAKSIVIMPGKGVTLKELKALGIPEEQAEQILKQIKGAIGVQPATGGSSSGVPKNPAVSESFKKELEQLRKKGALPKGVGMQMLSSVTMKDEFGVVILKHSKDGQVAVVKDKAGKVLFNGPVNTEEEKKAIPADILKRLRKSGLVK